MDDAGNGSVRQVQDAETETWDDPVRGRLSFRTLFSSETTGTSTLTSGVAELQAEGLLAVHQHAAAEVYYVLEGRGVVTLGDRELEVVAGSSVSIPGALPHGIRNTGADPLRVFYVLAADGMGDVEYDFTLGG
jgi:mannose-6-phosphate isomerase-like protein (cupin superfamily)